MYRFIGLKMSPWHARNRSWRTSPAQRKVLETTKNANTYPAEISRSFQKFIKTLLKLNTNACILQIFFTVTIVTARLLYTFCRNLSRVFSKVKREFWHGTNQQGAQGILEMPDGAQWSQYDLKIEKRTWTEQQCVRFGSFVAEMGECHSCTQQFLLPGGLYYSTKNYYVNGFP